MLLEDQTGSRRPRNERGQVVSRACLDPNCDGQLVYAGDGRWHCDGLTHDRDDGPLIACEHHHVDGDPIEQRQAEEWAAGRVWNGICREFRPALPTSGS